LIIDEIMLLSLLIKFIKLFALLVFLSNDDPSFSIDINEKINLMTELENKIGIKSFVEEF